jgi:uncharacterized MAPEG superfamily protein
MTVPFWCLLIVIFFPYGLAGLGGYYRTRQFGRLDNKYPRSQAAALEGTGARVFAAQQNAWEALPVFASAVFVAHLAGADPRLSATAAEVFLGARILHAVFYVANLDIARSAIFFVGFGSCIWLFVLAAQAGA